MAVREQEPAPASTPVTGRMERYGLVTVVVVVGVAITVTLFLLTQRGYRTGERRLLGLQTRLTADAIASADPLFVQDHLGGAVRLAAARNGAPAEFAASMRDSVTAKGPFDSASLWLVAGSSARPVTSIGARPLLAPGSARAAAFVRQAAASRTFVVTKITSGHAARLGYAIAAAGTHGTFVAYTEEPLPASRRISEPASSPISQLNLAVYLGRRPASGALLETDSAAALPLRGLTYTSRIPFGDTTLTITTSPRSPLSGALARALPWAIVAGGVLLTAAAGLLTERLLRRRQAAERLSGQLSGLYQQQRSVAEMLQHALLPQQLPTVAGMDIAVRYLPGAEGDDIGGDWYDVVPLPDGQFVFLIGDVSGHGVRAASVMAKLHYASRAYALEGHPPAAILDRLRRLLDLQQDGHFATVVCGLADVAEHQVTLANAGHLPPLICTVTGASFAAVKPAPPIGIATAGQSTATVVQVPPGGTMLCYTDGLVERRGESLDAGLKRLAGTASRSTGGLDDLVAGIIAELAADGPDDDIALMGLRWLS